MTELYDYITKFGAQECVDYCAELSRNLRVGISSGIVTADSYGLSDAISQFQSQQVSELFRKQCGTFGQVVFDRLREIEAIPPRPNVAVSNDFLNVKDFVSAILGELIPDGEISYFVMRSIRVSCSVAFSHETADQFRRLASACTIFFADTGNSYVPIYQLERLLMGSIRSNSESDYVNCFFDTALATNEIEFHPTDLSKVQVCNKNIDSSILLSQLFGLKTSIGGFDTLFYGCGIVLPEKHTEDVSAIPGRIILIEGKYATGKSLLAAQLCCEVARKGGVAWYFSLEQTVDEVCFFIKSMGLLNEDLFDLIEDEVSNLQINTGKKGALVVQRLKRQSTETSLQHINEFIKSLDENENKFPIHLVCIDPFNEIATLIPSQQKETPSLELTTKKQYKFDDFAEFDAVPKADNLRSFATRAFEDFKEARMNVLLVTEESEEYSDARRLFSHISDVKIRLSIDSSKHDYAKRYIEVEKSRLQVEQRGRHHFSIKSGHGIEIYPTSAAVRSGNKVKYVASDDKQSKHSFGLDSVDRVLGGKSIQAGDNLLLSGPIGSLKTHLALMFLLHEESPADLAPTVMQIRTRGGSIVPNRRFNTGLFISMRYDQSRVDQILGSRLFRSKREGTLKDIAVCSLTGGYSTSGVIYKKIQEMIHRIRWRGGLVDRVVLDDITVWENLCPFIKDDPTFVNTLIDLLQRNGLTVLATHTTHDTDSESYAQQSLVEVSDSNLDLSLVNNQGLQKILIRAKRSRNAHRIREAFELKVGDEIEIEKAPSLLRLGANGRFEHIPIFFFIQVEALAQKDYFSDVIEQLKACLATTGFLAPQELINARKSFSSGGFAATDELQVLQLDEFQLQNTRKSGLHCFDLTEFGSHKFTEFDAEIREQGLSKDNTICAVPFYNNFSCLAISNELWGLLDINKSEFENSWEWIVRTVEEIRKKNQQISVFDFPNESDENLNCLFLEIFFEVEPPEKYFGRKFVEIIDHEHFCHAVKLLSRLSWGKSLEAKTMTFAFAPDSDESSSEYWAQRIEAYDVGRHGPPLICRHWFSTLRQMLANFKQNEFSCFTLPGNVTTAGQWYLGVPSHSAVPQVGLELIAMLTSADEELKRLHMGVGLPARQHFYTNGKRLSQTGTIIADDGLEFFKNLKQTCKQMTIKRSEIEDYFRCSPLLAAFLRNMIRGVPLDNENKPKCIDSSPKYEINRIQKAARRLKKNCLDLISSH